MVLAPQYIPLIILNCVAFLDRTIPTRRNGARRNAKQALATAT